MARSDYNNVDWTLSDKEIAQQLNKHFSSVREMRVKLGIQAAYRPGQMPEATRFKSFYKFSPKTQPIRDLDYEFAFDKSNGRIKSTGAFRNAAKAILGEACLSCGYHKPPVSNHVHHIIPISNGGKNCVRNATILCSRCHDEVHAGLRTIPAHHTSSLSGSF